MYIESYLAAIGGIQYSNTVSTAAVSANPPCLRVNRQFWVRLNKQEKSFIIEHEMLHLVLKHHSRFAVNEQTNIAADLAINSMLLQKHKQRDLPTLFPMMECPAKRFYPDGLTTEQYLQLLRNEPRKETGQEKSNSETLFGAKLSNELAKLEQSLDEVRTQLTQGIDTLGESIRKELKSKPNVKFLDFLVELCGSNFETSRFDYSENWSRQDRKYSMANIMMPSNYLCEDVGLVQKNKILVFLDYSGSCKGYVPMFEKAFAQIPKFAFDIKGFLFATQVAPISNSNSKYEVGAGTSFDAVVRESNRHQYNMVWIMTDGCSSISEKIVWPKKWHWFMTPRYTTASVSKESHIHLLSLMDI